jgi:hypothetical protein
MLQETLIALVNWAGRFALALGEVFLADVAWVGRYVLLFCDRIPPGAAVLAIVLAVGIYVSGRAVMERLAYGEPLRCGFALGGVISGLAITGLTPYLVLS